METKFDDLAHMRNSRRWSGETCCLKKRPAKGETAGFMGYSAFGVITSSDEPVTIYLREDNGNDFRRTATYENFELAVADGWMVD